MPMSGGYADYDLENQQIERRRRMAEMLAQQGANPLQAGAMVGNQFVPTSWTQHLAQALKGPLAEREMGRYDQQQRDLGQRRQADTASETQRIAGMLTGTPGRAVVSDDQLAYGGSPADSTTTQMPDVAPDRNAAIAAALSARNPAWQQWGMTQVIPKTPKWEKAELPNADGSKRVGYVDVNSPNPLSTFQEGGTAPVKREFVNGQGVNAYTGQVQGPAIPVQSNPYQDLVVPDGRGGVTQNAPLVGAKKDIAAKGAANVSVKTDVKTGESLAGQVGPMMRDSSSAAEGAVKQVDAAQRIVNAVDSGKIMAGPGTTPQIFLSQLGQKMGVGGKDDAERLANTRAAIRGLAELTLQGRQQMKGQGAITESEGKLAERAMSGDIDGLTPAEIKQLAKASERSARFNYQQHERRMKTMRENSDLNRVAPFYEAPAMPAEVAPGSAVKRYNPATGTFE